MGLLDTLFKKGKTEDKPAVQTFEPEAPAAAASVNSGAVADADADAEKKPKHGEPGVCCGSCSN